MKHMKEVAKMLGVEMGERFKIKNSFFTDTYWFEWWGIAQARNPNGRNEGLLNSLLNGNEEIEKLPFKPKEGERYWFWCSPIGGGGELSKGYSRFGGDSLMCRECYMLGNCYRTEQECLADTAMADKIKRMERCKW